MKLLPSLLMFALINSCIELEISAPSFPSIMAYFGVNESTVGLTITMNLIGFCIAALIYGPLSDRFGRRKIMLLGNGILAIGATMCVFAPTMPALLIARLIQGLGAATSAVIVSAIIADSYNTKDAAKLYGTMNAVFSSIMALAPVLGGFINTILGWRGNYGIVAAISILAWLLLLMFLPETLQQKKKDLTLKVIFSDYRTLIINTKFIIAASVPSILYGCYMAFVAIGPFVYTQTLSLSMFDYTINMAAIVACFALSSFMASKITNALGKKKTFLASLGIQLIGAALMYFTKTAIYLTISMSIFALGFALIYPIVFAYSMEIFPTMKGTASSVIMSFRYLICAGLTFISSYNFDGSILSLAVTLFYCAVVIMALGLFLIPELYSRSR